MSQIWSWEIKNLVTKKNEICIIMSLLSVVGFEPGTFGIHVSGSEYMKGLYLVRHHYLVWHLHGVTDKAVAFKMAAIYPFL